MGGPANSQSKGQLVFFDKFRSNRLFVRPLSGHYSWRRVVAMINRNNEKMKTKKKLLSKHIIYGRNNLW